MHQKIYYSNRDLVPIREIAESLIALEGIVHQSPAVLEALFPGTTIYKVEVFLQELSSDSIYEDIVVKFVFGSQEKLDAFINNMRERMGMDRIQNNNQIFAAIILAMALGGGAWLLSRDKSTDPGRQVTIHANNNVIINVGAEMLDMDVEQFRQIIESTVGDKGRLARDSAKFVKPAKRDRDATITFSDRKELRINADTVQAMPVDTGRSDPVQAIEDYTDVDITIRAIDLDSHKRGWAAVVPVVGERRIRMQLDPAVDPAVLLSNPNLRGDVTVIFEIVGDQRQAKVAFLRKITEPKLR